MEDELEEEDAPLGGLSGTLSDAADMIEQVLFEVQPNVFFDDETVVLGLATEMEGLVPDLYERVDVCRRLLLHLANDLVAEGE